MPSYFQLISDDSGFLRDPNVELKTTEMPFPNAHGQLEYETCLFAGRRADVLHTTTDIEEAIAFHRQTGHRLGLHPVN